MRRSFAPSAKKQRTEQDAENSQPYSISTLSQQTCSKGITLGGYMGIRSMPGASVSTDAAAKGQLLGPGKPPAAAAAAAAAAASTSAKQFKCPLPNWPGSSSSNAARGTLGMKKQYAAAFDIMAAIQRKVYVNTAQQEAAEQSSSNTAKELVLYDPEEHRLQLQSLQEGQQQQQQQQDSLQDAATAATDGAAGPSSQALPAGGSKEAAAAPVPGAQQQDAVSPKPPDIAFGINWDQRVKVYADMFLVEKLRPHQREGVKFVFECLSGVRQDGMYGAVLADGMGLGKTFQTIASLYSLLTKGVNGQPTCKKPLILCPTSLVQNWGKELKLWLGERVVPVVVDDTRADDVKKSFQEFRAFGHGGKPKVLVMSYPCFRMHKAEVYRMGIDVVMCDEAHFLKNGEAQITQAVAGLTTAKRRLLMSGTPIQNDLSEFHAVFDLACPGLLGDLKAFNKMYEGPIQRGRDADATEKQVALGLERMEQLMKLCNKFMLRRTSTVLKTLLPAKIEQVVFCKLSPLQLKLYTAFLNSKPVKALLASTAIDPEAKAAAAAAAKAKRQTAKASKASSKAAAAASTQAPLPPPPPPHNPVAAAAAADDGDDLFEQPRSGHARRASVSSAAASKPVSIAAPPSGRRASAPAATQPTNHQQQQQVQAVEQPQRQPQLQQQQSTQKEDLLAPLAAITALKKLCCHPDLIWEMLNKHKVQAQQKAKQAQLMEMLQAQKRASARTTTVKNYAAMLSGAASSDEEEEPGAAKKGKGKAGSGRKKSSSAAATGSARQQLTGFEGCEALFDDKDVYPKYQAAKCQAFHSGKVMVLEALLKAIRDSEPTDKVVLVSNYTEALDVLGVMCASHGWSCLRLDGSCSVKQRQALVDTFNNPQHPSFVLLLSSKAGGVGLNIIGANRLVLFDPDWNPANDLQAMARVWREGQKKRVWIYRLLVAGSIEEKVLQRQLAKQGLSEALVDEVGQQVRTFSRDELRSLFRVDPTTPCDTHTAIKCSCGGTVEDMETCKERCAAAAAAAAAAESSGGKDAGEGSATEQQGVMAWAHLARAADSPDPTWQVVKDFVRDNFVTYVFSDHVLDDHGPPTAAAAGAAASAKVGTKRQRADGDEQEEEAEEHEPSEGGSSEDDDGDSNSGSDSEESQPSDSEQDDDSRLGSGCNGHSKQQKQRASAARPSATAAGAKPKGLGSRLPAAGAAAAAVRAKPAAASGGRRSAQQAVAAVSAQQQTALKAVTTCNGLGPMAASGKKHDTSKGQLNTAGVQPPPSQQQPGCAPSAATAAPAPTADDKAAEEVLNMMAAGATLAAGAPEDDGDAEDMMVMASMGAAGDDDDWFG